MMKYRIYLVALFVLNLYLSSAFGANGGRVSTFPLQEVRLLDGPFKRACDLNIRVLLQYDTDRLLAPFRKEAGLPMKAELFPNWAGLDGHVAGHYLSALSMAYAATGDEACKERVDYMLGELKACQEANGDGYLGGIPDGKKTWDEVKAGKGRAVSRLWAPWYNLHKMYAGLRDAWLYTGNGEARRMFLRFCDWGLGIIAPLDDEQMEGMLDTEFGGMNEVYADAYEMTGERKYLDAARRFSHKRLLDSMARRVDNLDNMHANTQVPKAVGYQRVAEVTGDTTFLAAADFFWTTVVENRSLSFGGNSRREHFPSADRCTDYVEEREGPESCNTYNMLKLTEGLFRIRPEARYADYYERAMFNHILSTQHPVHGGYVYFTSARPRHYRTYSTLNEAMWCCVGTGMENHVKYGEFIYAHTEKDVYVNLFVASQLNWKELGVCLTQETDFPASETVKLTFALDKPKRFALHFRYPSWVEAGKMFVRVNGEDWAVDANPLSYVSIGRKWKDGDVVEIFLPMRFTLEQMPNVPDYVSVLYGPVVLAARMGTEDLQGLVADDDRWGHIARGKLLPLSEAPVMVGTPEEVERRLKSMRPVEGKPLHFVCEGLFSPEKYSRLQLEPFAGIHDCRYSIYFHRMSPSAYQVEQERLARVEAERLALDQRTVDRVQPGEQQPETDHRMQAEASSTGYTDDESWRNAEDGGYFSYRLSTEGRKELVLRVRYRSGESGKCMFDILIDKQRLATEDGTESAGQSAFVNKEYRIPSALLEGKTSVEVCFRPKSGNRTGKVFYVALLTE